jgi:hypothetical protein
MYVLITFCKEVLYIYVLIPSRKEIYNIIIDIFI